jgi:HEAT repeats
MKRAGSILLICVAVLLPAAGRALADQWRPFEHQRVVSDNGRYYVVMKPPRSYFGKVDFTIAERGEGSSPVKPVTPRRWGFRRTKDVPKSDARPGDRIHARGVLDHAPLRVFVSSRGRGFVAVERWGAVGHGDAVVIVPLAGKPIRRLKLTDILDEKEIRSFSHSVSSLMWLRGSWLDEKGEQVVLVDEKMRLHLVKLDSAEVERGGAKDIIRGLGESDPRACRLAVDLALKHDVAGAADAIHTVSSASTRDLKTRLHAAQALLRLNDPRGGDLLIKTATAPGRQGLDREDRNTAIQSLVDVMGERAIPELLRILREDPDAAWAATYGLAHLGEKAIPILEQVLLEDKRPHVRGAAVSALGHIGSRAVRPLLLRAVRDEDLEVAKSATMIATKVGGVDDAEDLLELLEAGTSIDGWLAYHLAGLRYRPAIPAMITALERHRKDPSARGSITRSLERLTGQKIGPDPAAWRDWYVATTR